MKTYLTAVSDALAELTDTELGALIVAANEVPQIAPGLLTWVGGACDWEINRRVGRDDHLLPPVAAIDPSENAVSIEATYALRAAFATGDLGPAALKFLDAILELLSGGGGKH